MRAFDWKRLRVLVGIPTRGFWTDEFGMSMLGLISYFHENPVSGYAPKKQELIPMNVRGSILPNQRLDVCKTALEKEATHILWIDDDQTFPRQTLHRLLGWKKEIVAANVAVKKYPSHPTARDYSAEHPAQGAPVFTDEHSYGIQKVWRVGTGIMLMDVKVLHRTGLNIFGNPWREDLQKYGGEDWSLCEAMQKAGFEVFIDHELSNRIEHIGPFKYTHEFVGVLQNG